MRSSRRQIFRTFCGSMNQAISLAKMVRRSGADIKTLDFFPVEMLKTFLFGTYGPNVVLGSDLIDKCSRVDACCRSEHLGHSQKFRIPVMAS
jgi:hypothetical protein